MFLTSNINISLGNTLCESNKIYKIKAENQIDVSIDQWCQDFFGRGPHFGSQKTWRAAASIASSWPLGLAGKKPFFPFVRNSRPGGGANQKCVNAAREPQWKCGPRAARVALRKFAGRITMLIFGPSAGHISWRRGPHLARGPHFLHHWHSPLIHCGTTLGSNWCSSFWQLYLVYIFCWYLFGNIVLRGWVLV